MNAPSTSPQAAYQERLNAAHAHLARLDTQSARLANLRGLSFLVAAGWGLAIILGHASRSGWWGVAAAVGVYAIAAFIHGRVHRAEAEGRIAVELNQRGLMRLDGRWRTLEATGARFQDPEHPCTPDLDVFGQGSLFQLINVTATTSGEETLARWLQAPADAETLSTRQGAVRELSSALGFRQELAIQGALASATKADPGRFVTWAETGTGLEQAAWARPLAILLPLITLTLFVLERVGVLVFPWWWAGVAAQLLVVLLTRKLFAREYARVVEGEEGFARYERIFAVVEAERFEHPHLQALQRGLSTQASDGPLSRVFRSFSQRLAFAQLRQSNQLHPAINLLTLWDVHALFALENWRRQHGAQARRWFESLAELEALSCLAGLSHDRPEWTFPTLVEGTPAFSAQGLVHPLLDTPVPNDVSLTGPSAALLVTGSNMSGKTTLLRAMGLNALIALAGGPVAARHLSLSALTVVSAMRVRDSLEQGVSYFHAEVRRLKAVVDAVRAADGHALFLLDEILTGTNTRDRQLASHHILSLLLECGAIGAVTTHDLGLAAQVEALPGHVVNVHFRDTVEDGVMRFDYRMREGVVDTTNALRVLELAGLRIPEPATG
ncbi:MAG TPA: DNA mismatch repair protein MutS [Myxococcaceae bacterium]|nr:DNA mismatch repair protein MutS [Myxococcaceae bacterium]